MADDVPLTEAGSRQASKVAKARENSEIPWIVLWASPRVISFIFFVILFLWIYQAEGGIGFTFLTVFGWHALLMSIFVVILTQEAILTFSSVPLLGAYTPQHPRFPVTFHLALHLLGITCAILGLVAIVQYKALSPQPEDFPFYTAYSPHSWVAMTFLSLWCFQLIGGLALHTFARSKTGLRKYHRFLGFAVYLTGLATCMLGLQAMQSSDLAGSVPPYVNTTNFTQDQIDDMGYYPDSQLARYSSAACVLLVLQAIAVLLPHV